MAHAIYKMQGLGEHDALHLFRFHAFPSNSHATGYEALLESVACYAKGNPLALKVLGSSLKSKSIKEWESALDKLKTYPDADIQKVLRISFDGLGDKGIQDIFLDMACFFTRPVLRERVESILNRTEHSDAAVGISALIDKSLLIEEFMRVEYYWSPDRAFLEMHGLLQQMGQGIVCDENKDLGNRSRLWKTKDVHHVLEKNTGTSTIEGILLHMKDLKKDVKVSPTAFSKMHNLRFLKIMLEDYFSLFETSYELYTEKCHGRINLLDGLESFVSDEIRCFHWDCYPLKYLPYFSRDNLVELIVRGSQLELLWNEAQPLELVKLKKIDLSYSEHLIQIPNLSRAINLQHIDMTNCENLEDGIENFPNNLRVLNMGGTAIKSLPESICKWKYLEILDLSYTNLRKISEISAPMECLVKISLSGTEIEELPESIENLTVLEHLFLCECDKIKFLPNSLCNLMNLMELYLDGCSSLEELPPLPHGLMTLCISECERLKSIAELPSSLYELFADDCTSLETISSWGWLPREPYIDCCTYSFKNCRKLDDHTCNKVIADRARRLSLLGRDDVVFRITYPGDEIPEWFSCQTDGGKSINIHLPPNWFKGGLTIVFCSVFYNRLDSKNFEIVFKTSDGMCYSLDDFVYRNFAETTDSDHVFINSEHLLTSDWRLSDVFGPDWSSICSNITEASFRVRHTYGIKKSLRARLFIRSEQEDEEG